MLCWQENNRNKIAFLVPNIRRYMLLISPITGHVNFFRTINTFIPWAKTGGKRIYLLSGPWFSSLTAPAPCPPAHGHLRSHVGLVLKWGMQEACPAGSIPLEDCWSWHCFSFHHISSEFSLIFSLFKISSFSGISLALVLWPREVPGGTHTTVGVVCCE